MISKTDIKLGMDNAIKELGCDNVENLTNEQLLDIIAGAIANAVPDTQQISQDLDRQLRSKMNAMGIPKRF